MTTRLSIIKAAQARIGDEPLETEDDAGADTHLAIYDSKRDDIISRYPWSFATVTRRLTRLTEEPAAHWSYFYQLPTDMLGAPRAVFFSSSCAMPSLQFELTENRLATDADEVWLRFQKRPEPELWPGYFVELVTLAVMTEMALSVREDQVMWSRLRVATYGDERLNGQGGQMAIAMSMDSQSKPSAVIAGGANPLIDVRV